MPEKNARRRRTQPSGGLVALGAVLLAASSTSLSASSSVVPAADAPAASGPARAPAPTPETGADGGTPPNASFPVVERHLTSGRFVNAVPPAAMVGIPATVLAAYRRAVERTNLVRPNCHLPLELLAAIGKVESGHARGGQVDATGRTPVPILGPVLNGGPFAAIRDTDGGALDGDRSWDRAVGPMQFIPGTWARWQADGNDDGSRDPHNVYDAGLAAARYLCAADRDLGTAAGIDEAVLSYNHSTSYLSLVRAWMSVYQNGTITVADVGDAAWVPVAVSGPSPVSTTSGPPPSDPPTTSPTTPPSTPPSTSPSTPPSATPTTPPTTPPSAPPSAPPSSPPTEPSEPPTMPTSPPVVTPPQPPTEGPVTEECGLVGTVADVAGGLVGGSPDCVPPLELSAPETTPVAPPSPTR